MANLTFRQARIRGYDELAGLFLLYSVGFTLLFLLMALLYRTAACLDAERSAALSFRAGYFGIFCAVGVLSSLLALAGVGVRYGIPGGIYFMLAPLCFAYSRLRWRPEYQIGRPED